ncbi:alpha/beta hydrolase family protein [Anatilimnocola sp. NA78]|uniref:alpha/beta hydrolase family protein n=1 Tax=Anatilimnocola sp. NA78 TaxID=3415683 RepID=UPI003CE47B8B
MSQGNNNPRPQGRPLPQGIPVNPAAPPPPNQPPPNYPPANYPPQYYPPAPPPGFAPPPVGLPPHPGFPQQPPYHGQQYYPTPPPPPPVPPPPPAWAPHSGYAQPGFPAQGFSSQPGYATSSTGPRARKKSGAGNVLIALLLVGGLAVVVCCGGLFLAAGSSSSAVSADAKTPFKLAAVPVPPLPKHQSRNRTRIASVDLYRIPLGSSSSGHYSPAGHGGSLFYYVPPGNHAPGSLPCVMITGAGTNLLQGSKFDRITGAGDAAEHLPYVQAGIAVLVYEMDGGQDVTTDDQLVAAYKDFKAACAGMVNARNAFQYILKNCEEVDKSKIFTAGHSSAGTSALLFAAHEKRIAGCIAYAPCADVENFHPPAAVRQLKSGLPGLASFLKQSSPTTHAARIRCPVMLFTAEDDSVVPASKTRQFSGLLQRTNPQVTLKAVPRGEHYDAMIQQGIPAGIEWIKQRAGG